MGGDERDLATVLTRQYGGRQALLARGDRRASPVSWFLCGLATGTLFSLVVFFASLRLFGE